MEIDNIEDEILKEQLIQKNKEIEELKKELKMCKELKKDLDKIE